MGCVANLIDRISFISGTPNLSLNVSGDSVCEGDDATVTIAGSEAGVNYQLLLGGNPLAPAISGTGTGADLIFTIPAARLTTGLTAYSVEASATGCSAGTLIQPANVTVNPPPTVTINPVTPTCIDASAVTLAGTPTGGTFSGPGVTGNSFDPGVAGLGSHTVTYVATDGNGCTNSNTMTIEVTSRLTQVGSNQTSCAVNGQSYTLTVNLNGTAPYIATGTGAPGTFAGTQWISDPIPAGTDYNVDFQDANACNVLNVSDVAPTCCVFAVTCPTFPVSTVECYADLPGPTSLTEAQFESLGNGDGIIGDIPCGVIEITASNGPDTGNCNMNITRTYTITEYEDPNSNGLRDPGENTVLNTAACSQSITIRDTTAPVFVEALPNDTTVECDAALPPVATLTATDNCSSAVVSYDEEIVAGACAGNYEIRRTWSATDSCGNETTHLQTIRVEDTTPPAFGELLPVNVSVACNEIPAPPVVTANDNCGVATITFSETELPGSCSLNYVVERTWVAADECGNETMHTQLIDVSCPIEIYNAVSPNDNGQNDIFLLEGIDCFPNNNVKIFNRWGILIFELSGYDNDTKVFNGYSQGRLTISGNEKLPTGTYFYIIQYQSPGATGTQIMQQSGHLYLSNGD